MVCVHVCTCMCLCVSPYLIHKSENKWRGTELDKQRQSTHTRLKNTPASESVLCNVLDCNRNCCFAIKINFVPLGCRIIEYFWGLLHYVALEFPIMGLTVTAAVFW